MNARTTGVGANEIDTAPASHTDSAHTTYPDEKGHPEDKAPQVVRIKTADDAATVVAEMDGGGEKGLGENDEEIFLGEAEFTEEEYHRVKRKTDWVLLPLMWWMYGIQQTDKTGLGTMNLFGLQKDTGMHGTQYSLLTVMFYTAYAIFEFPFNYVLQRYNMGKTLAVFMLLWGIVVFVQAFFNNWSEFMAFRFLQGALECTISPGFNIIISRWYLTEEHSSRTLAFQSANAGWGIVAQLVYYGFAKREANVPGSWRAWRGIEAFLGAQTLVAAGLAWMFLGTPGEVSWLNHREKIIVQARVMRNHAGSDRTGKDKWKWDQVKDAFMDPVLYFQFINTFLACVMNGAITTFGSVLQQAFGFDIYQVTLYEIPRNAISTIWFILVGVTSTRWKGLRFWWMIVSTVVVFICLMVIALLPPTYHYRWLRENAYWWTNLFVIPSFSAWALISSNTAGRTKISVMSAMTFIAYCTGNIAGSQVMKPKDAPRYLHGTTVIAICMGVDIVLLLVWRYYLVWQNRKRAAKIAEMGITSEEAERRGQVAGAQDITDTKNVFFTYSL